MTKTRPVCPAMVEVVKYTRRFCPETGESRGRSVSRSERVRCMHDPEHVARDGVAALHAGDSTWGRILWRSGEDLVELEDEAPYRGRKPASPSLPLLEALDDA